MTTVLLVRLSALGDVVQSLGAVQALAAARPDLALHFVVQEGYVDLLRDLPLASVIPFARRAGLGGLRRLRAALRSRRVDVALDLQGNWKSAAIAWLSGARRRIGAGATWRQEPLSHLLLTERVTVPGPRHPATVATAVVRALAPAIAEERPRLVAAAAEQDRAAAAVRRLGIDPTRPFRVIVPGDPGDPRSLRPELLPGELAASPHPGLFLLGPDEAALPAPAGAPVLRHGPQDLRQLVGLGGLLARLGGDALGPDQGPLHVLAATGCRSTVLFGPQDPAFTAPPAARVLVRHDPPPCQPCQRRTCRNPDGPVCMAFASHEGRTAWPHGMAAARK